MTNENTTTLVKNITTGVYQISTVNPETGHGEDFIATVRQATNLLYSKGVVGATGRCTLTDSPDRLLSEAGFTVAVEHFVLFLDRIGLVRKLHKEGSNTGVYCYLVFDPTFFDLLVTDASVIAVLKQMRERRSLQDDRVKLEKLCHPETGELVQLRAQVVAFEGELADLRVTASRLVGQQAGDGPTFEDLAVAVAAAEDLRKQVAELRRQLDEKKPDPRAIVEALLARARSSGS